MKRFFSRKKKDGLTEDSTPSDPNRASGLLTGDPAQDQQSLEILLESIAEVTQNIELEQTLQDIVDRSLEITQAERACVLLGSDADHLEVRVARDGSGAQMSTDLDYSRSVVKRSIEERRAGQYRVSSSQEALELGQSVYDLKLRTVMCAPLEIKDQLIGVIYVDSKAVRGEFSERDVAIFEALSSQLAVALENARLHEDSLEKVRLEKDFEIAQRIQQHLLPTVPTGLDRLELACHFAPASQASGDTYDVMQLDANRVAVMLGDVTGHGVGAALLSHAAQAAVRSYLELVEDLGEVMTRLNNRLVAGVEAGMFMSAVLLVVDTQKGELTYVNAGHPPILLVRGEEVQELEKTGMVLGVIGEQDYSVRGPIALEDGDLVFLSTDGLDETMNAQREVFGEERVKQVIVDNRQQSAAAVLAAMELARRAHGGGDSQEDDVTMVMCKVRS